MEGGRRRPGVARGRVGGWTLVEALLVLALVGLLAAFGVSGFRAVREAAALHGAEARVRGQMALARRLAVTGRRTVRLTRHPAPDALVLLDPADSVLARLRVGRTEEVAVDSLRLRPATLRFNSRGQAAPGSVYLWRGRRGVRLVANFLGRVRREPLP